MTEPRSLPDSTSDMVAANEALVLAALHAMQQADEANLGRLEAERLGGLDALTQIPGRAQTLEALAHAVAQARRGSTRLAVLFLDLDKFKCINDQHGHGTGDEVLKEAALRMKRVLREADFVGRFGGDEFVAVLTDVAHPADAAAIADKLIAALVAPLRVDSHVLRVTPSIGIALFPDDATTGDALLARADAAMYCAKSGPAGHHAFSHELPRQAHAAPRAHVADVPGHALLGRDNATLRAAQLGLRVALLGVLCPHGALRGERLRGKILRRALALSWGDSDEPPGTRGAPDLASVCLLAPLRKVAVGILPSHLVCRRRGPCLLLVPCRLGTVKPRSLPGCRRIPRWALLHDAMALAHEGHGVTSRAGDGRARVPAQPYCTDTG